MAVLFIQLCLFRVLQHLELGVVAGVVRASITPLPGRGEPNISALYILSMYLFSAT
jgi:hypothetical protein